MRKWLNGLATAAIAGALTGIVPAAVDPSMAQEHAGGMLAGIGTGALIGVVNWLRRPPAKNAPTRY